MSKPSRDLADPKELLLSYLDTYRSVIIRKVDGLSDHDLRTSRLPSGWTPLGLLKHLAYMERRWLVWGFLGEDVADPWGDDETEGTWYVSPPETAAEVLAAIRAGGDRTRAAAGTANLSDRAVVGGRFSKGDELPTLGWILHHVLREYARHAGHLDIARELIDGAVGE